MPPVFVQRVADSAGVLHSAQRALQFGTGLTVEDHPNDTLVGVNGDGQVTGFTKISASIPPGAATVKDAPYNAVGDGVADDFTAVHSAFAAASDFFYPVGTYRMRTTGTIGTASSMHRFVSGGKLSVDTGVVVTIHGTIDAGRYQIFSGSGTVVLDPGVQAKPEWWGAVGDGVADDTAALVAALASGAQVIDLTKATHLVSNGLTMTAAKVLRGVGRSSIIRASSDNFHLLLLTTDDSEVHDIALEGGATAGTANAGGTGQFGIFTNSVQQPARVKLRNLYIGGKDSGHSVVNGVKIDTCDGWIIENVFIDRPRGDNGTTGAGYGFLLGTATNITILDSRFQGDTSAVNGRHALYVSAGCSDCSFVNVHADQCNEDSFPQNQFLGQPPQKRIRYINCTSSNRAVGSTGSGAFSVNGDCEDILFLGCVSLNDGGPAWIVIDGQSAGTGGRPRDIILDGCTADSPGQHGVLIQGASDVTVRPNCKFVDVGQSAHGSYPAIVLTAASSGVNLTQVRDCRVGGQFITRRRALVGELTIATPPTFKWWGQQLPVTSVAGTSGNPITLGFALAHGFSTGDVVAVSQVGGMLEANGRATITSTTSTTITINKNAGSVAWTVGGYVVGPSAHGLVIDDALHTRAMPGNATGVAGRIYLTKVIDTKTAALETSHGVDSIGGGSATLSINGATNAAPIVAQFTSAHGLVTGMRLLVDGDTGNRGANGLWTITVVDSTHVQLDGSSGTGASAGTRIGYPIGDVYAPTHRSWIQLNATGPVPVGTRILSTDGIPGGTQSSVTIEDGGVAYSGSGPVAADEQQSGAQAYRSAAAGDLRLPLDCSIRAHSNQLSSPGSPGSNRLLHQDGASETLYIGNTDAANGCYVEQTSAGFFRVLFNGVGTSLGITSSIMLATVPLDMGGQKIQSCPEIEPSAGTFQIGKADGSTTDVQIYSSTGNRFRVGNPGIFADAFKVTLGASAVTSVLAFYGAAGSVQQTVNGSRDGSAATASALTALANLGLIVDNTTAGSPPGNATYSWTNTTTLASGGSAIVADPAASTIPTGKSGLAVCYLVFKDNVNQSTSSAIISSNFKNVSGTLTVQSAGGGGSVIVSANGTGGYNIGGGTNVFSVSGTQLQFSLGGNGSGNSCSVMATVVLYYF